ncbi:MAG: hypothetical protein ACXVP2_04375, partial [Tumebacillaceae bacterium]
LVLPVVETRSDARGEVVLSFGNYRTKKFDVRIEFLSVDGVNPGDDSRVVVKEVMVEEGTMTGLGVVVITP